MADIKKIKLLDNSEYNIVDASATHIQTVTLAQWEALTPQQQASGDYVISDATLSPLSASLIPYDNTTSGLIADDVQGAIDEVASDGTGSNIFEVTQAEYDALKQAGTLVRNALYVISDGDNLNATASDIEYSSGVSVKQAISSENTPNTASYLYKPTVTEPTLTNGTSHNHRTWYYKHGTRVCMSIGVSGLTTGLSGRQLFTLPSGYRPRLSLSMICCGYSFDKLSAIQILDNGNVVVQYTQDQGCFAYIEFDAYS